MNLVGSLLSTPGRGPGDVRPYPYGLYSTVEALVESREGPRHFLGYVPPGTMCLGLAQHKLYRGVLQILVSTDGRIGWISAHGLNIVLCANRHTHGIVLEP
jgi:hypothetical protein